MPLLKAENLRKSFGGLKALDGISLSVERKEIRGIIGPNGSGKTTLLNVLSGVYKSDEGTVIYDDQDITNLQPHKVTGHGLSRTFQVPKPFMKPITPNSSPNPLSGRLITPKRGIQQVMQARTPSSTAASSTARIDVLQILFMIPPPIISQRHEKTLSGCYNTDQGGRPVIAYLPS